ncbi:Hypothetical protein PBC10988_32870 [Planctomycetales bacterium 10988]|nr:Hypothetical protein PBC10988_32870 [Planctomycetales bacterium 10988]
MVLQDLIELAVLITFQSPLLCSIEQTFSKEQVLRYEEIFGERTEHWHTAFHDFREGTTSSEHDRFTAWEELRPICDEVILSELLTRICATLLSHHGHGEGSTLTRVAERTSAQHSQVRQDLITLLTAEPTISLIHAAELVRLQAKIQRWVDLLLGYFPKDVSIQSFVFDHGRASEFRQSLTGFPAHDAKTKRMRWALLQAALADNFKKYVDAKTPHASLNEELTEAILAFWNPELFDTWGHFQSDWMRRLTQLVDETQGCIDQILSDSAGEDLATDREYLLPFPTNPTSHSQPSGKRWDYSWQDPNEENEQE